MATREDFERANERGRQAEERVFNVFRDVGWIVQWKFCAHRRDISVQHPEFGAELVEVKNEDNYADGDNVCIELGQKGRKSGLLTSEATICIHTFGDMCLVYRTQPMRNWLDAKIASGFLKTRTFGDNENNGVIVSKMMFAARDFAEWVALRNLPRSKVFAAVAQPA